MVILTNNNNKENEATNMVATFTKMFGFPERLFSVEVGSTSENTNTRELEKDFGSYSEQAPEVILSNDLCDSNGTCIFFKSIFYNSRHK